MSAVSQVRLPAVPLPQVRVAVRDFAFGQDVAKIRAEKFSFFYGSFQALREVSLQIHEDPVTALIGPSGCGKSTFLRALNRMSDLTPKTRATVALSLDGRCVWQTEPTELRRRVGMVFQRPNPFPKFIYENVAYGLRVANITDEAQVAQRIETSLGKAALWDEVKDKLKCSALSLSGGQQQRLCIARAPAVEPEVLLLDEPCSALDPISTAKIEETLFQLRGHHTTVIVTHSLQQAARVSDHTDFFLMGRLIEFAPTPVLFETPQCAAPMTTSQGI